MFPSFATTLHLIFAISLALILSTKPALLDNATGRQLHAHKTNYASHGPVNNDRCWANSAGMACEDVKIHYPSNTAFLACGYPKDRLEFYPGAGNLRFSRDRTYHEYFVKYEIDSNVTTRLEIENWDRGEDLVLHGLDIWQSTKSDEILIYAVNHKRTGESVVVFSHRVGTSTLHFVEEFMHPLIKTPNQVAAAGRREFFVANDHYFYKGLGRQLEMKYGPFNWASSIVHCTKKEGDTYCKQVSTKGSHSYVNGILLINDGKTLVVGDAVTADIAFYEINSETRALSLKNTITLGATPDNLSELFDTGDLIVAVVANETSLYARFGGPNSIDNDSPVEAAIVRLAKAKGYAPEVLYWDDGSQGSLLTAGAVDRKHTTLIASGVFEQHFIICSITY